jgi:hypothetical protein
MIPKFSGMDILITIFSGASFLLFAYILVIPEVVPIFGKKVISKIQGHEVIHGRGNTSYVLHASFMGSNGLVENKTVICNYDDFFKTKDGDYFQIKFFEFSDKASYANLPFNFVSIIKIGLSILLSTFFPGLLMIEMYRRKKGLEPFLKSR